MFSLCPEKDEVNFRKYTASKAVCSTIFEYIESYISASAFIQVRTTELRRLFIQSMKNVHLK